MKGKKEYGRKDIAAAIAVMTGANSVITEADTVDVFKFVPPAVAQLLGDQLREKQELAKTDESVELIARVEFHNLGVFNARILPAETKLNRNPKTGEVKEKDYKARTKITFSASDNLEDYLNKYLDLGE